LTAVTVQSARQDFWSEWLSAHLPAQVRAQVAAVVEREGELVIFAPSAAWSARLRYAVLELEAAIRGADPGITGIAVRVLPRP
jgi:hypothetical protein